MPRQRGHPEQAIARLLADKLMLSYRLIILVSTVALFLLNVALIENKIAPNQLLFYPFVGNAK